ncbi:MAG: hypothetical protein K0R54_4340 [Clostridiaceae bacterium]|jgi:hypothetical protein|nr:hypothetical protein [Clostridiaceae bacterium]
MIKVVYFDEGSATDYLTIKNGGTLIIKNDKVKENKHKEEMEIGGKLQSLFNVLFLKGDASIKSNIGASHAGESLIKTSISNSILSDFFDMLNAKDNDKIEKLEYYSVIAVENSIAYFQTITPYLSMTDGNVQVSEDFALQMSKMHETLKSSKGYYELLAINNKKKDDKKIFRFNNEAFKNNYGIVDLTQMNLVFHGIKVGNLYESNLDFTKAFDQKDDDEIIVDINDIGVIKEDTELPVFDIILAGVE